MMNKILIAWAICLLALAGVVKLANDDIQKQYDAEREKRKKDNTGG